MNKLQSTPEQVHHFVPKAPVKIAKLFPVLYLHDFFRTKSKYIFWIVLIFQVSETSTSYYKRAFQLTTGVISSPYQTQWTAPVFRVLFSQTDFHKQLFYKKLTWHLAEVHEEGSTAINHTKLHHYPHKSPLFLHAIVAEARSISKCYVYHSFLFIITERFIKLKTITI